MFYPKFENCKCYNHKFTYIIAWTAYDNNCYSSFSVLFLHIISIPNNTACGLVLTAPGTFSSPYFPLRYPNLASCTTYIQAPTENNVVLRILHFAIEVDGSRVGVCKRNYDTFRVYDGPDNSAPLVGEYCGNLIPSRFQSSGRNFYIVFKTDFNINRKGYNVSVSFESG